MTDWDDLRLLLAVSRAGTLQAAAEALGTSQPTLSRRMATLSKRLGATLLQRQGSKLALTAAGLRAVAHVERMDHEAQELAHAVSGLDRRPQGSVRLTVPEGLGVRVFAPRLMDFLRRHPGLDLVLFAESAVANLSRSEADLALRLVRPEQRELVVRTVARTPFSLYATPQYLRDHPRPRGALLGPEDELVALHEQQTGPLESEWLRANSNGARLRVRVRSPLAMQEAVLASAGIGLLPRYLGEHPSLRRIGDPLLVRPIYLVSHRALARTARLRLGIRFVEECLPWI